MTIQENFKNSLEYQGRILETEGTHVWGTSIVKDDDGKYHAYFSSWDVTAPRAAWVICCKIMHAVADKIEGPYEIIGEALSGSGGNNWDAWSIHNPSVNKVDGKYVMVYMGSNGNNINYSKEEISKHILDLEKTNQFCVPEDAVEVVEGVTPEFASDIWSAYMKIVESKRVGMAISDTPYGPWKRISSDKPIIEVGKSGEWDDCITSNPAFIKSPEGKYMIYYKSWSYDTWETNHGNRKYGLAISDTLEGEYKKYENNPVVNFEPRGGNAQLEDANVFYYKNQYHMVARDMGVADNARGMIMSSSDGIHFSEPVTAYGPVEEYIQEKQWGLRREGRYERAQVYMENNEPRALICGAIGGKYKSSSAVVFNINLDKLNK